MSDDSMKLECQAAIDEMKRSIADAVASALSKFKDQTGLNVYQAQSIIIRVDL